MVENQDVEFKAVWKDEYLKWVCGMANSNGGTIYIGKDDKGELDKFMLERVGKRWEDLPVKNATFEDLSEEAFKVFKEKAVKSGRLKADDIDIDNETLLKNLGLYDGKYLNKAAILLFGKNPNKWIIGSYIKIGFFENDDSDLRYQDEIQGPLILQVDKAIELIYLKYLKALIHYEGIQRVEEYMFPQERI